MAEATATKSRARASFISDGEVSLVVGLGRCRRLMSLELKRPPIYRGKVHHILYRLFKFIMG